MGKYILRGSGLLLVLLLWGYLVRQTTPYPPSPHNLQPSSRILDVTATQFSTSGKIESELHAVEMRHNAHSDTIQMSQPVLRLLTNTAHTWLIHARHATATLELDQLTLQEAVQVQQPGHVNYPTTTLTTEQLIVFPATKRAQTDAPVHIQQEQMHMDAMGFAADLAHNRVHLLSHVRGTYADTVH